MAEAFVGLDLGTTGVKAVAFDADDSQLAAATLPTPTVHLADGGAEYDADELWLAACEVLRIVSAELEAAAHCADAIAVASMGESGVLIDADGRPLVPSIAWFDPRTEPQAAWWRERVGVERTQRLTGLTPRPVFGGTKMRWVIEHEPEAWAKGHRWLNMADWVAYRLTGEMATDHSLASRTMLFDLTDRRWSDELTELAGIEEHLLAPLVESGRPVGRVTADAAAATGLAEGVVVGAGGQDHVCAALALDVTRPGMVLDSIGTAEALFVVTEGFDGSGRIAAAGISQGAHVEPGRTYAMTGIVPGGGRIDQRRADMGLDWAEFLATEEARDVIDELARVGQTRLEEMLVAAELTDVRHIATGGGSENTMLIERKTAIGGRPIEVAAVTEATSLGAARLARRAAEST